MSGDQNSHINFCLGHQLLHTRHASMLLEVPPRLQLAVEGGYLEDGKSLSNWDVFSHIPGNIKNNETGDIADDNYHRFLEDAEIAHTLGVNAYRFSISWARILPRGRFGKVNRRGIEFYNKVIDSLLRRGKSQERKQGGSIGIIVSTNMYEPLRDVESDRQAVNRLLAFNGGWIFDPLVFGDYPPEMRRYHRSELPRFSAEETECLKGSIDYIGINHYSTSYAKDCIHSPCPSGGNHFVKGFAYTTGERDGVLIGEPTGFDRFYVVPRGMEKIVDYFSKRYKNIPIYVTENGYSSLPVPQPVPNFEHDFSRIEFHKGYLAALARAIRKGADVRGYFIWSLMDNFEWAEGYGTRFGLYRIDRGTMKRTPKLSAKWFQHFLSNRHIMIAGTEANATVM
ncbi:hypothetical protein V6N12_003899 [Hibiscus sabdariffa]|uniref:Beta-glucosidase 18-like n=1 Tax=Hibiscus sabdariffa TaxID=183260 RepID=A0ABR2CJV6_9ROSI